MTGQLMHLAEGGTVLELRETDLVHSSLGVERPDVPAQKQTACSRRCGAWG
jgi:hypothetical protein